MEFGVYKEMPTVRGHAGILENTDGKTNAARIGARRGKESVPRPLENLPSRGPLPVQKAKTKRARRARIGKAFFVTKALRILGHTVRVERVRSPWVLSAKMGESDVDRGVIRILAGLEKSVDDATVLHEAIHIISDHLSLDLNETEVSGIAQGLFALFQDNPEFLR
jgi:hypothetical protein